MSDINFNSYGYLLENQINESTSGTFEFALSDANSMQSNLEKILRRDAALFAKFKEEGYTTGGKKPKLSDGAKKQLAKDKKVMMSNTVRFMNKVLVHFSIPKKEKGNFAYKPEDPKQAALVDAAFVDTKFNAEKNQEYTTAAYKGVSELGQALLAAQIHFYK
jgi:hypothetical protein